MAGGRIGMGECESKGEESVYRKCVDCRVNAGGSYEFSQRVSRVINLVLQKLRLILGY